MKKTFIYIFLGWMMCAVPLSAQHWDKAIQRAEKAAAKASRKYNGNLNKALKESSAQAKAVYNALKKTKYEKNWLKRNTPLIPPYSKLSSLAQGWILANNQAWLIGAVLQEKNKRQLLKTAWAEALEQKEFSSVKQLARLIPPEKKYIFMGEYHENYLTFQIQRTVAAYTRLHPEKQVIVFSEFVPEDMYYYVKGDKFYTLVLGQYQRANIPWVGLKEKRPEELFEIDSEFLYSSYNLPSPKTASSLIGIQARNSHWIEKLKTFRQMYPNAVFFIHAGSFHIDYQLPYTVSAAFNPQETFVMKFNPYKSGWKFSDYNAETFHQITKGKLLRPGVLIWKKQKFARMAGFDVQVILPLPK